MDLKKIRLGRDNDFNFEVIMASFIGQHIIMNWACVFGNDTLDDLSLGRYGTLVITSPLMEDNIATIRNCSEKTFSDLCKIFDIKADRSQEGWIAAGTVNPRIPQEAMSS